MFFRFSILLLVFLIFSFFLSCSTTNISVIKIDSVDVSENKEQKSGCSENLSTLFDEASLNFDKKNFDRSKILYEKFVNCFPDSPKVSYAYFNLALIAFEKKLYADSAESFKKSWYLFDSISDKADAVLLMLDSYRSISDWDNIVLYSNNFLEILNDGDVEKSVERELLLRRSEAYIELGDVDEGSLFAKNVISNVKKETVRGDRLYIPELAYGYYILGRGIFKNFMALSFKNDVDTLTEKCALLLDAQNYFLLSIRSGILYWSNASAYSVASLYLSLFDDMDSHPFPENLSSDEKALYKCELWKKTAVLLRKARRKLELNIAIAKRGDDHNEYVNKSMKTLLEINAYYSQREAECSGEKNEKSVY